MLAFCMVNTYYCYPLTILFIVSGCFFIHQMSPVESVKPPTQAPMAPNLPTPGTALVSSSLSSSLANPVSGSAPSPAAAAAAAIAAAAAMSSAHPGLGAPHGLLPILATTPSNHHAPVSLASMMTPGLLSPSMTPVSQANSSGCGPIRRRVSDKCNLPISAGK